ncbi:small subunit ribosomal protein S7 [Paragonimus westermani]|uniref:Small subunit ribosomal protein S7 n=1 Tax=Paragonimus westermani TaxID=34504 RepID=A0A5J4N895_9TREM|nr:small subunit ribosomal protein S7 [Paragonimus westermani]
MTTLFRRVLGLIRPANTVFLQPSRSAVYHYALKPKLLRLDEEVAPEEERLFKPVAPADKWEHTSSNYDSLVARITGIMTERGEREKARDIMRRTLREIKLIQLQKYNVAPNDEKNKIILNPIALIHEAVKNCTPLLVLHSVVRGGILYKVPAPPRTHSVATHIAIRFLVDSARDKPTDERFWKVFARLLIDASQNQGRAYKKKEDLHKQCEENRAYANYRTY